MIFSVVYLLVHRLFGCLMVLARGEVSKDAERALVAADRGERRQWARHRALLNHREVPVVPAPVLAQAWRGGSRQALLSRLLTGCDTEALDDTQARATGALAARAATTDIVNACVVEGALRRHDLIISSDPVLAATMFAHELAAFEVHVVAGLGGDFVLGAPAGWCWRVSGPGGCRGRVRRGGWQAPRLPLAAAR